MSVHDVKNVKSVKVSAERHRRLKIVAAHSGLSTAEALEKFGGPAIDAEYARQCKESLSQSPPAEPAGRPTRKG